MYEGVFKKIFYSTKLLYKFYTRKYGFDLEQVNFE